MINNQTNDRHLFTNRKPTFSTIEHGTIKGSNIEDLYLTKETILFTMKEQIITLRTENE